MNKLDPRDKLTSYAINPRLAASLSPVWFCKQDATPRFRGVSSRPAKHQLKLPVCVGRFLFFIGIIRIINKRVLTRKRGQGEYK